MSEPNPRLARLTELGTSIWLDQLHRGLITSGDLARMTTEVCLRGVTSNPAIFKAAIVGNDAYDEQLAGLARSGADPREIYRALAIEDIQGACDALLGVWEATGHADGFVSFEVDPDLAFDTAQTLTQAKEYWARVDRPNLMIKIPGTDEGLPAITEALAAGINVNVTLLFAVEQYEKVMHAFIAGMERRLDAGQPLDVHSVASFFVSRVDTEVDERLGDAHPELLGQAGVANARAAYAAYERVIGGEQFARLRAAGAPVQRPLWASTGVKNPAYSDVLYVDELAGPDTVNTMPLDTLHAAADHSEVTEARCTIDPSETLSALAAAGIDMADVTATLLTQGVDKFVEPMDALLAAIEARSAELVSA
ncbi:MAG: transaldolase [Baekduia sp.]